MFDDSKRLSELESQVGSHDGNIKSLFRIIEIEQGVAKELAKQVAAQKADIETLTKSVNEIFSRIGKVEDAVTAQENLMKKQMTRIGNLEAVVSKLKK